MSELTTKSEIVQACWADPIYFAENFVRLQGSEAPVSVILDSGKTEFFEVVENEDIVVGRYPRRYGKTTALHIYALHQALFGRKNVAIQSGVVVRQIQFLGDIAVMHRNLPSFLQDSTLQESPDCLRFLGGEIRAVANSRYEGRMESDVLLIDEPAVSSKDLRNKFDPYEIVNRRNKGKIVFTGTFSKDDPIMGTMWSEGLDSNKEWTSLPTRDEENNIRAVLEMSNPAYSRGY